MVKSNGYETTQKPRLPKSSRWSGSDWYIHRIGNKGAIYVAVRRGNDSLATKVYWTNLTLQVSDVQQVQEECDRIAGAIYEWWDANISD